MARLLRPALGVSALLFGIAAWAVGSPDPRRGPQDEWPQKSLEQLKITAEEHESSSERAMALARLARRGKLARRYLPWLAEKLTGGSETTFETALSNAGPPGESERPALTALLRHADAAVRQNASRALYEMASAGVASADALESAARAARAEERDAHLRALFKVAPDSPKTAALIRELFRAPGGEKSSLLASFLIKLDPRNPEVLKTFRDAQGLYRWNLANALLLADPRHEAVFEAYRTSSGTDRTELVDLLSRAGAQDEQALTEFMKDAQRAEAASIRYILRWSEPAKLLPVLLEHLKSGVGSELGTIYTLGELGPAAAQAVPALTERLASERAAVRSAAAYALGRIAPGAPDSQGPLKRLLRDPSPSVRRHAQAALGSRDKRSWLDFFRGR